MQVVKSEWIGCSVRKDQQAIASVQNMQFMQYQLFAT